MKELIKNSKIFEKIKVSDISAAAATQIIVGVLGVLSARAAVSGKIMPFGVSILAAVPFSYMPSAAIGAFLGYFIPATKVGGFRYIAALLAVLAIKLLLSGYKSVIKSPVFILLIPLLSLGVTAPVLSGEIPAVLLVAEAVLSSLGAYFLSLFFYALSHRKAGFSEEESAALFVSLIIFLTGISAINLFGVYLYRIIWIFLILVSAKYGGQSVCITAGVSAALCAFLINRNIVSALIFAGIGICIGAFRGYGKWVLSLTSLAASLVSMMISDNLLHPALLFEVIIGSVLFLCLPVRFSAECGKLLSIYPKVTVQSDLKKMIKFKLLDAADALSDVKNTVNEVSNRLSMITSPDFSGMLREVEAASCDGCKLRIHCWETKRGATVDALTCAITKNRQGVETTEKGLGEEFRARCLKPDAFYKNSLTVYDRYAKSLEAENRAKQVRQVVSEQFEGISLMLKETANDIARAERFDKNAAEMAALALKNLEINASESICKIDKFGRKYLKIKATADNETVINKMKIMKALSNALDCDIGVPTVTGSGNDLFIAVAEAPKYKVQTGACQISAFGSSMCGDSYKFILDGYGRFFIVLSDGMGTGGAAAVDSAMSSGLVSRLIKSGINVDSALKIINSSMLFKSTLESTATLDIACVDLFSGNACIYKAGAAPSLIKKSNKILTAKGKSLPIGILSDVHFEKAEIRVKNKDIILMMSDGATGESIEWIKRELENCGDITAQSLSENIAAAARRRRSDGHEDDITVISAIIEKAV